MEKDNRIYGYLIVTAVCMIATGIFMIAAYTQHPIAKYEARQKRLETEQFLAAKKKPTAEVNKKLPFIGCTDKQILSHCRIVALYGTPDNKSLGVLGDRSLAGNINYINQLTKAYQEHSKAKVVPAFEIITTVASSSPTENKDYSNELSVEALKSWVSIAAKSGIYVVLDLQPGRTDFLTQAKQYAPLLEYPNVGLALDPEWRLKPNETHLKHIGSVDAAEINKTTAWLAEFTKSHELPQKILLIHQFKLSMVTNRDELDTHHPELAYMIQMDGHGTQQVKRDTWQVIRRHAPDNVGFGWKNFYKRDTPMLSPPQTMKLQPVPAYVSYQ